MGVYFWTVHILFIFIFCSRRKWFTSAAAGCFHSPVCVPCVTLFVPVCVCLCVWETQTVLHSGHFSTYQRQCEIEGHHPSSVAIVKADGGQLEWQLNPPHTFSPPSCFLMPHFLCSHLFIVVQSLTHVTDHLSISHVSTLGRTFCSVGLSEQICMPLGGNCSERRHWAKSGCQGQLGHQ